MDLKRGDKGADTNLMFQFCLPYDLPSALLACQFTGLYQMMTTLRSNS